MGQFGKVEMTIQCESEDIAIEVSEKLNDDKELKEFIAENTEGDFDFNLDDVSGADEFAYIKLSSGRNQHAVWMAEMIHKYLIEFHKDVIVSVEAELLTPDTFICWNKEEVE